MLLIRLWPKDIKSKEETVNRFLNIQEEVSGIIQKAG